MTDLEKIRQRINKVAEGWLKDHENIEEYVYSLLSKELEKIIKVALGFKRDSWHGGWEVDFTNGRHRDSVIGREFYEQAQAHARRIFAELAATEIEAQLTLSEQAKLIAYYKAELTRQVKDQLQNAAEHEATQLIHSLTKQEISLSSLDDKIKTSLHDLPEEKKLQILTIIEGDN